MNDIINAWKGWRLEFEQEYGSDMDGVTEYTSYSEFDWTQDLAEILQSGVMGWMNGKVGINKYSSIYIEEASVDSLKVHFTCGYEVELTRENPGYTYSYCFGHGDYRERISLVPPGEKRRMIEKYSDGEVHCRMRCEISFRQK